MNWTDALKEQMTETLTEEIKVFATQIELRKQNKIDEALFNEARLRRGVYGQRYDNGQRHDGTETRTLNYPSGDIMKGPGTLWDAPGMVRIKIPMGRMTPEQLDLMADLADEYADGILHMTTRQDIQLHFVHIEETVDLMARLAAVGITTREACGNSVRNVTACQLSGVCRDEEFDVTPYAHACADYLLGHEELQDFGRKFKIAFSGCKQHSCGLASMHDLGLVARTRKDEDGKIVRGFECHIGGGLGAVPHQAKIYDAFLPEEELLPTAQAIGRVFGRLGEKRNRARARIKFLIAKLGLEEFSRLVREERKILSDDPRRDEMLERARNESVKSSNSVETMKINETTSDGFDAWVKTNAYKQRQAGYNVVTVTLPLGDMTTHQARMLADISRRYTDDELRITVPQNIVLRWIRDEDLSQLYADLKNVGLNEGNAEMLSDITVCPGTDTCKLGIASSRGLTGELRTRLRAQNGQIPPEINALKIKVSGCFNSCGQHHVADLGFYGVNRKVGNHTVPHFQVVLGGQIRENASSYGLAVAAIPSRRIPDVVEEMTSKYLNEKSEDETFQSFIKRVGKAQVKEWLAPFAKVPDYFEDRSYYSDWGDSREFTMGDIGKGECAGEVVSSVQFGLADSEREVFEAQLKLDEANSKEAAALAYQAMLTAARSLIKIQDDQISKEPNDVVAAFKTRFVDSKLFNDPFAGSKFANYLTAAHKRANSAIDDIDEAHRYVEEAQLFIEAAHACYNRMG